MAHQFGKGAASLPGVRIRFYGGTVRAEVEGLAGASGRAEAAGLLARLRPGLSSEPAADTGLASLQRAIDDCLQHRRRLQQAVRAATARRRRAKLRLDAASIVVVRLLAWPLVRTLRTRVREADFPLHAALHALKRCAIPVTAELDAAATAAYDRLEASFDRVAESTAGLERAVPGPVVVGGRRSLRLASARQGEALHLLPGLALLERRDGGFVPLDPLLVTLGLDRRADSLQSTSLAWLGPGLSGALLAGDGSAAQALADDYDAYRRELNRLAMHHPEAVPAAATAATAAPMQDLAMVPPEAEHRLPWFPVADLAALGAMVLAALVVASPGLFRETEPATALRTLADSVEVAPALPDATTPAAAARHAPVALAGRAVIRVDAANIRAEPRPDAAVVGRARRGDSYEVLEQQDAWIQVGDGATLGWIREDLVELN
jgi:hypothetical protein